MLESKADDDLEGVDAPVGKTVPSNDSRHSAPQQDSIDDGEQLCADSGAEDDLEVIEVEHGFRQDNSLVSQYGPRTAMLSGSWISILQDGNKKYPLREKDRTNFRGSGWLDLDETGNYDPTTEHKKVARPAKVLKRTSVERNESDDEHPEPKRHQPRTSSYGHGRRTGRSHLIAPNVKSQEGLEKPKVLAIDYSACGEQVEEQETLDLDYFAFHSPTGRSTRERKLPHTQRHSHSRYVIYFVISSFVNAFRRLFE
jgi:hypothetical protein